MINTLSSPTETLIEKPSGYHGKKPLVVFIDDEPQMLSGLQRGLRKYRSEWRIEFLEGGQAALDFFKVEPRIDAIVSDMRMPGVNGAQVLQAAAETHPESFRMALSGYAEQETLVRALGPAHRFLSKPLDAAVVGETVARGLGLRRGVYSDALRSLVKDLDRLPTPSAKFVELTLELDKENASTQKIGSLIKQDLALSAHILRLVNSPYFGLPQAISSIRSAINLLGLETIRSLLVLNEFFTQTDLPAETVKACETLAQRSLSIASLARQIAAMDDAANNVAEDATVGALLSHIGSLVLMTKRANEFSNLQNSADANAESQADPVPFWHLEHETFGVDHGSLGAYLAALWGFSDDVVETVYFHHRPSDAPKENKALFYTHVAQWIARSSAHVNDEPADMHGLDVPYITQVDRLETVLGWQEKFAQEDNIED